MSISILFYIYIDWVTHILSKGQEKLLRPCQPCSAGLVAEQPPYPYSALSL